MFGDDIGNAVFLADFHRCIPRPLGTMGMQDIRFTITGDIVVKHIADNRHPSFHIPSDGLRHTPLERLEDSDTILFVLITTEGKDKKVLPSYAKS